MSDKMTGREVIEGGDFANCHFCEKYLGKIVKVSTFCADRGEAFCEQHGNFSRKKGFCFSCMERQDLLREAKAERKIPKAWGYDAVMSTAPPEVRKSAELSRQYMLEHGFEPCKVCGVLLDPRKHPDLIGPVCLSRLEKVAELRRNMS